MPIVHPLVAISVAIAAALLAYAVYWKLTRIIEETTKKKRKRSLPEILRELADSLENV